MVCGVLVVLIWLVALVAGTAIAGVLGYELLGHARRTRAALEDATADLLPKVQALRPPSAGRHRAGSRAG